MRKGTRALMMSFPLLTVGSILPITGCSWTDGPCWFTDDYGGGDRFLNPSDCTGEGRTTCNAKCMPDYFERFDRCKQLSAGAQRQACEDEAYARYKSCPGICQAHESGCLDFCHGLCSKAWNACGGACQEVGNACLPDCTESLVACHDDCDHQCL